MVSIADREITFRFFGSAVSINRYIYEMFYNELLLL